MPSDTFNNLSLEKRKRIIQKCYEEFSQNSFREASLSKIVSDLGIAKGSIYKYFEDKQDLYFYLIDRAAETKLKAVGKAVEGGHDILWEIMQAGALFDIENPLLTSFLNRVFSDSHVFEPDIRAQLINRSCEFLMLYVKEAKEKGAIRKDIDDRMISLFINGILIGAGGMLAALNGIALDSYLSAVHASREKQDKLFTSLADIYKLLMYGIAR
jgi:AcrR family transcriptional regulator